MAFACNGARRGSWYIARTRRAAWRRKRKRGEEKGRDSGGGRMLENMRRRGEGWKGAVGIEDGR